LHELDVRRRNGDELEEITVEWFQGELANIDPQQWNDYLNFVPVPDSIYYVIEIKEAEKEEKEQPPQPLQPQPTPSFYTGENYNIPFTPLDQQTSSPVHVAGCVTPLQFFHLFILPNDLRTFAAATNEYASSIQENFLTNCSEVRIWIALCIHMGIMKLARLEDYWSASYQNNHIFSHMSRDKYKLFKRFFHPSSTPSTSHPLTHPFHIILPFIAHLPYRFRRHLHPSTYLSLDESMIAFKSWTPAKQFMRDKPIKYGFKAFTLAVDKGGYLLDFFLYPGKKYLVDNQLDSSIIGIVTAVATHFFNKHHVLVVDKYFTSKFIHSHSHFNCSISFFLT
jgi:hypothetical protein